MCNAGGLDVEGSLTGTDNVPVMVADNGDGSYTVSYTPKKTGPYDLDIKVNGKRVGGQGDKPVKLLCIPGKPSGKNSIAFGPGIETATIGQDNKFTVQAKDAFGNNVTMGGSVVGGTLKGPNGVVVPIQALDNNDGTYECTYPGISQIGNFELTPTLDGESVKDAPFHLHVFAGETDPNNTVVNVPSHTLADQDSISIELRDAFGNKREKTEKDNVRAYVKGLTHPVVSAHDNGDGTYTVDFPADLSGNYEVHVTVNDQPAPGGPWTNQVMSNPLPASLKEELNRIAPDIREIMERVLGTTTASERELLFADLRALESGNVKADVSLPKAEKPKKKKVESVVHVPVAQPPQPEPVVVAAPEPVVEAQPEPVVVAQPEPVVVAQPEPVVVAQPEPEPVVEAKPEPEKSTSVSESPREKEKRKKSSSKDKVLLIIEKATSSYLVLEVKQA